jgi:hypothetical protein
MNIVLRVSAGVCTALLALSIARSRPVAVQSDGQHDFDFDIGAWATHLKRLEHPLSGSTTWLEYSGTTVVTPLWNGRANLAELQADGPAGHLAVLSLRLYNPATRQWSLNVAGASSGTLSPPSRGRFSQRRGEFYSDETFNGGAIRVRFVISEITVNACHFEQAFSRDGGKSWEVNWIATDTRISPGVKSDAPRGPVHND